MVHPKQRKDGRWYAQIYIKELKKYFSVYGKTERECENNIIAFLHEYKNGNFLNSLQQKCSKNEESRCFIDLFEEFLNERLEANKISINTKNDYMGCITTNMNNLLSLQLKDITLSTLKNNYEMIKKNKGSNLLVRVHTILNPFFNKLSRTKKIDYNFLNEIEIPARTTKKYEICDTKTLKTFIELLKKESGKEYLYMIVLLVSFFGTRISETLAIDYVKSFNREKKILRVIQQQTKEKGKGYFIKSTLKTSTSMRNVIYLDPIMEEIEKYYKKQNEYFNINGITKDARYETLLLLNKNGTMVKENTAHRHWSEFIKKYKDTYNFSEKITFHSFRRYFSEWLHQAGVDKKVIKEFMGHSKEQMTEYYQFEDIEYSKKEMEKVIPTLPF